MPESNERRPSNDPAELVAQLLRELRRLSESGEAAEEPELFRAYLQHFQALAWDGVARGNLNAPREVLDHLLAAQPFVDALRPELSPAARAAVEVEGVIRSFYLAARAVAPNRVETRLADRRSETEREVLQVLLHHRGEYLRRQNVYDGLDPERRPTPARVGQILVELYHDGLLQRIHGPAQGNANASFYALSPRGVDVCRRLGMALPSEDTSEPQLDEQTREVISAALRIALEPSRSQDERQIATALLVNSEIPGEQILHMFEDQARAEAGDSAHGALKESLTQVLVTKPNFESPSHKRSSESLAPPRRSGVVRIDDRPIDTYLKNFPRVAGLAGPNTEVRKEAVKDALKAALV